MKRTLIAAGLLPICPALAAAQVTVSDWLEYGGGSAAGFSLLDSSAATIATGRFNITSGIAFPGQPAARVLNGAFWDMDMVPVEGPLGSSSVSAFEMRVVPQAGMANFQMEIALASPQSFVFAIGELYGDAGGATGGITLDGNGGTISFLGSNSWDNGLRSFSSALAWDGGTSTLSRAPGAANGDSEVAFFLIEPGAGLSSLTVRVPSGYGSGLGDSLTFAVGTVPPVPEPAGAILLLAAGGLVAVHRHRK